MSFQVDIRACVSLDTDLRTSSSIKAGMYLWQTEGTASVLVQTQIKQNSLEPSYSSHGNRVDMALFCLSACRTAVPLKKQVNKQTAMCKIST